MLRRVLLGSNKKIAFMSCSVRNFSSEAKSDEVQFPLAPFMLHRHKRFQMPYPRGEAWGQVLTTNNELPTPTGTWTPNSKRVGVLCRKVGMMMTYTEVGTRIAVTVLQVDNCQILHVNPQLDSSGKCRVQLGCTDRKVKHVSKQKLGFFHSAKVHPKQHMATMKITPDAVLPVGWKIDPRHFTAGQFVNVFGTSIGKGFAGVMKRHGFGGQPASHGVSVSHRSLGSTGQNQFPGHVFKNKKMPGRMGGERSFIRNLRVYKVDPKRNLIFIAGPVPGATDSKIELVDADWKPFDPSTPPPFPTFVPPENDTMDEVVMPRELFGEDPFAGGAV